MKFLALLTLVAALSGCTVLNSRDGLSGDGSGDDGDDTQEEAGPITDDGDGDKGGGHGDGNTGDGDEGDGDSGDGDGDSDDGDADSDGGVPNPVDEPDASMGHGPFVLFEDQLLPTGIALKDDELCWVGGVEPRGLYCGARAGAGEPRRISTDAEREWLDDAFDLAFDGTHVYWSNGKNNQIVRKARSGGTPSQYFTGGGHIAYLSEVDGRIFATNYQQAGDAAGHVIKGPHGNGSESQLIYPGEPHAAGIAVVNGMVFWGTSDPDQLAFGPEDGNARVTRVNANGGVTGVAVDAQSRAYFIAGNQRIYTLTPGSNQPELLYEAEEAFGTSDIALDEDWLYWSEREHGRIMRMRRQ